MKILLILKPVKRVLGLKFPKRSAILLVAFICTFTVMGFSNEFYKDLGQVSLNSGDLKIQKDLAQIILNYELNGWNQFVSFYKENFKQVVINQKDLFIRNLNKTFALSNHINTITNLSQNNYALNSTENLNSEASSYGQVLAATNIVNETSVRPAQSINNLIYQIENVLNKYISEGRFVVQPPQVIVIPSYAPTDYFQTAPVVTYINNSAPVNSILGTTAGVTYLSAEEFTTVTGLIKDSLTVEGSATISGTLTATSFVGDGSLLTGISSAGISGGVAGRVAVYSSGTAIVPGSIYDNATVAGINATSSSVSFLIQGASGLTPLKVTSSSGDTLLVVTPEGYVGFGTSTPSQAVTISGNLRLTGALFDANNASGTAGMVLQTTGTGTQWVATSTLGISGSSASLATGTVTRMNIKNLNTPAYKYNSSLLTSTTLAGVSNIQSSFFDGNYMWFGTDTSPAKLIRVDPITSQNTTYTLNSGEDSIFAMTTDGTYLYVSTLTFPSKIIKIDPVTGNRIQTYTLSAPANRIINMLYDGNYIWGVTLDSPSAVIKFDPTDGSFVSYPMNSGDNSGWGMVSDGTNLWISTDTSPAKIFKFVMSSGTYTSMTLSSPNVQYVDGGVFDGTNVWFSSGDSPAKLVKINPQTNQVEIFNMNPGEHYGASLTFDGQNLWMSIKNGAFGRLLKIDPKSPYSHTTYNLDSVNVGMTNVTFDGTNIWTGTYSNPAVIYRIPNAGGNSSFTSAGYFDFTPTTTSPSLLIQQSDSNNWNNTTATYLGVNATSTFSGNLLDLQVSGTTQLRVTSQGRIGINSTTPTASLAIRGTGSTTPLSITSSTGASILVADVNSRVGVGTSSPVATLTVQGVSTFGSINPFVVASSSGTQILTVTNKSKVGIGSTNPGSVGLASAALEIADSTGLNSDFQLRVSGNNQASIAFLSTGGTLTTPSTSTANTTLGILEFDGYDGLALRRGATISSKVESTPLSGIFSGNLIFSTNSSSTAVSERMRITSIGNVGIGTTTPNTTLSVNGTTTSISFNASNLNSVLQVNGSTLLQTPLSSNLFLGVTAGFANTTGTSNTLLGYEAGHDNTSGSANTFIGLDAGYANTTGSRNNFIGLGAGNFNANGNDNVYLGYYSGVNNSGNANIWIGNNFDPGSGSLRSSTIALGYYAQPTANNQMVIGSSVASGTINSVYIGQGVTKATPEGVTLYATGGSGTNNAGGNFGISAGRGTGNVASGNILFITSDPVSSGSTAQPTSTKAVITSTGRLGIGTSSPIATLTVMGTTSAATVNPFIVASSSGAYLLTVNSNGNVGIGTSTASQLLTVGTANNFTVSSAGAVTGSTFSGGTFTAGSVTIGSSYMNWSSAGNLFQYPGGYLNTVDYIWKSGTTWNSDSYSSGTRGMWHFFQTFGANTNSTTTGTGALEGIRIAPIFGSGSNYEYNSSNPIIGLAVAPRINVRSNSTGGYVGLLVNTIETSTSSTATNYIAQFQSNTSTKVSITAAGYVGIGTSTPSAPLEVKGSGSGATIAKFTDNNSTGCTLATGGTISCSSDSRLKKNISDLNYGLNAIMSLRPVEYNWNYEEDQVVKNLGFIAQEVQQVIPKLVNQDSTGQYQLNSTGIVPVLTKAIQEQQTSINNLQQTLSNLQNSGSDINPAVTTINVQLYLSEDSVGEAKILAGHNLVRVTFKNPYLYKPIVTITAVGSYAPAYVTYIDHEGFTIKLDETFVASGNNGEYMFAWHSFAGKDSVLFVSDGNNELVNIEVVNNTSNQSPPENIIINNDQPETDLNTNNSTEQENILPTIEPENQSVPEETPAELLGQEPETGSSLN